MKLVVGLGNPGKEYEHTRHNVGFLLLDALCSTYGFGSFRLRDQGLLAEGNLAGEKLLALKPTTYMNRSGIAVAATARFYKIPPADIIVLHDEVDLPLGKLRIKQGGSSGGHNGLKSIDAHMGQEYWRLRFGVGHPGHRDLVSDYVLSPFSTAEWPLVQKEISAIVETFPTWLEQGPEPFLTKIATLLKD